MAAQTQFDHLESAYGERELCAMEALTRNKIGGKLIGWSEAWIFEVFARKMALKLGKYSNN